MAEELSADISISITGDPQDGVVEEKAISAQLLLTNEQMENLKTAFNLLDHDGIGKIKADDFRVAIKALGFEPSKTELKQMVDAVDRNSTGMLSFENFTTAMLRKMATPDTNEELEKSFRLFDDNDTGSITMENLKNVSQLLDIYMTDEELEEMLDDADKDFDGEVNMDDFVKYMKRVVPLKTP